MRFRILSRYVIVSSRSDYFKTEPSVIMWSQLDWCVKHLLGFQHAVTRCSGYCVLGYERLSRTHRCAPKGCHPAPLLLCLAPICGIADSCIQASPIGRFGGQSDSRERRCQPAGRVWAGGRLELIYSLFFFMFKGELLHFTHSVPFLVRLG